VADPAQAIIAALHGGRDASTMQEASFSAAINARHFVAGDIPAFASVIVCSAMMKPSATISF
jgi:hypothetical protein